MQELLIKVRALREGYGRPQSGLSEDDLHGVLAQVEAHLTLQAAAERTRPEEERKAQEAIINRAIGCLSYSELLTMDAVATYLNGETGLFVGSIISEMSGATRSVIVPALSKFEAAGIIKSHSLGMKGTRIRTLIPGWGALVKERVAA